MKYRFGTHNKIGFGRCFCIQKENIIGNWTTIYETDNEINWNVECKKYISGLDKDLIDDVRNRYDEDTDYQFVDLGENVFEFFFNDIIKI